MTTPDQRQHPDSTPFPIEIDSSDPRVQESKSEALFIGAYRLASFGRREYDSHTDGDGTTVVHPDSIEPTEYPKLIGILRPLLLDVRNGIEAYLTCSQSFKDSPSRVMHIAHLRIAEGRWAQFISYMEAKLQEE